MNIETKSDLRRETVAKLQKLIQANVDSRDGFLEAADKIHDDQVAAMFRDLASERASRASELGKIVVANGEEAKLEGSAIAALHRYFIDFRAALNGGNTYVILAEAERGEDHIKHLYEDVLKETAGSAVNDLLQSQYAAVKKAHDRVRELRDARKDD